jgi:hypothetical protein
MVRMVRASETRTGVSFSRSTVRASGARGAGAEEHPEAKPPAARRPVALSAVLLFMGFIGFMVFLSLAISITAG